jgi:glycosyltransferase involved in cell wall biosynthesis
MAFSAVIATTASSGRRARLLEIIQHICRFDLLDEVIVVWQSTDLPGPEFDHPKLRVFLCQARAVSLARNLGAYQARADWVWFLDDDTIPASDAYLERAKQVLDDTGLDFLTSNVCGEGVGQVCRRISVDVPINERTIEGNFWEPGLIVARSVFLKVPYDICLGPGCLHGSSEGSDLGIRLLRSGYKGMRVHDLELDHPRIERPDDYRNKLFLYAIGNGLVAVRRGGKAGFLRTAGKSWAKMTVLALTFRGTAALDQFVRLCGLLVGPWLQPSPPMNLEPRLLRSDDILSEHRAQVH